MTDKLIDTSKIAEMLGLSTRHAREFLVHRADFPRPTLQLSIKTRRWSLSDVEQWIEKQRKKCSR